MTFAELQRALGLGRPQRHSFLPEGLSRIGRDYLNDEQGAGGLFSLYSNSFRQQSPNLSSILARNQNRVYSQYKAAAALTPTLTWDDYLSQFDEKNLYKSLNPFERGERPGAFARGFRSLG